MPTVEPSGAWFGGFSETSPPEGTVELYSTVQAAVSPTAANALVTPVQVVMPESDG
jgi:hypothetical protein